MRYTATALTAATRPVVLTIGRVSDRRGLRTLSRWWVRRCRTWTAKPLSVPQMLQLQAARQDPLQYLVALAGILRAILPRRWWYRVVGDPVVLILRLPAELLQHVLQALVTVPGSARDVSAEVDDPIEVIRRAQRVAVYGEAGASGPQASLAIAALSVRAVYGDTWYWNPARWATSDGYAPFAVALLEYAGAQTLEIRQRLVLADGMALPHVKNAERMRQQLLHAAYPAEVC